MTTRTDGLVAPENCPYPIERVLSRIAPWWVWLAACVLLVAAVHYLDTRPLPELPESAESRARTAAYDARFRKYNSEAISAPLIRQWLRESMAHDRALDLLRQAEQHEQITKGE